MATRYSLLFAVRGRGFASLHRLTKQDGQALSQPFNQLFGVDTIWIGGTGRFYSSSTRARIPRPAALRKRLKIIAAPSICVGSVSLYALAGGSASSSSFPSPQSQGASTSELEILERAEERPEPSIASSVYNSLVEPIATCLRFVHLTIIFVPVLLTIPMIWLGSRRKDRNGERVGTLWWYGFLVRSMERAGPAFIKVRSATPFP